MSDKIKVLVVDDSSVFRRLLRDLVSGIPHIEIIAEAENGIEALKYILKYKPDVLLLDLEMPLMDGMTALQHLMVHRPTPTIIFSSLTDEGSARAFDTLKNGAVDFMCKDFFLSERNKSVLVDVLETKITGAANLVINAQDLFSLPDFYDHAKTPQEQIVFCEECGSREVFLVDLDKKDQYFCSKCGDSLHLELDIKYLSNNCITLLAGGAGSFNNYLDIIPSFDSSIPGTLLCIIDAPASHVDQFTEYVSSMATIPVSRVAMDTELVGGNCYIAATSDNFCIKSVGTILKISQLPELSAGVGPVDLMFASASQIFKKKVHCVILSSHGNDSIKGLRQVVKLGGGITILEKYFCLHARTREIVKEAFDVKELSVSGLVRHIRDTHRQCDTGRMG
ncbi:MAG: response regulator [Desulfotalea sp.]